MLHFLCFDCIMCKRRGDLETASLAAAPAAPYAGALAARAQGAGFRLPLWGAAPPRRRSCQNVGECPKASVAEPALAPKSNESM